MKAHGESILQIQPNRMITKADYQYAKKKAADLDFFIIKFEVDNPLFLIYKQWLAMTPQQRIDEIKKWDDYYASCRAGYYGLMFEVASEAFRVGDIKSLRSIGRQVTISKVPFIKPPSVCDPRDLKRKMERYFTALAEFKEFKGKADEYAGIYESKRGSATL